MLVPILKVSLAGWNPSSPRQWWCCFPSPSLPLSRCSWKGWACCGQNVLSGRAPWCRAPWPSWGALCRAHAPCVSPASWWNQLTGWGETSTCDRRGLAPFRTISSCRRGRWRHRQFWRTWMRTHGAPSLWWRGGYPASWSAWRRAFSRA